MTGRAIYPWNQIKADYVEGHREGGVLKTPSLSELSQKYGCDLGNLKRRAAREGWTTQQKHYQQKIEDKRREKKSEALASEAAAFDAEVMEIARTGLQHVRANFDFYEHLPEVEGKLAFMDDETLERLGRALERYQRAGRIALGESTADNEIVVKLPPDLRKDDHVTD